MRRSGLTAAVGSHLRLTLLVARPQLVTLLAGFALLGETVASGRVEARPALGVLLVVVAFVVAAVAVNDLADREVDRLNLPHDARRPLVTGAAGTARPLVVVAGAAAVLALVAAAAVAGPLGALVVAAGLLLVLGYSLPPLRLSGRGALAALVLPAGYVAVPYLTGVLAGGGSVGRTELALLAAAYVGFVGRILLKDFRDVTGDALLGKRTFLVRHGQALTCAVAALCWTAGSVVTRLVAHPSAALDVAYLVRVAVAVGLLALLAVAGHPHVQTALISASAVLGRGLVLALVLHLLALARHLSPASETALQGVVLVAELATVWRMTGRGTVRAVLEHPVSRSAVGTPSAPVTTGAPGTR